jgi:hypothetical protein
MNNALAVIPMGSVSVALFLLMVTAAVTGRLMKF